MTSSGFRIVASADDFGAALLTDAEFLMDHAAEHQVTLWRQIRTNEWLSPAWLTVTTYYWGFFLALALSRMLGNSAWFLNQDMSRDFRRLAGPILPNPPGSGCYRLQCGNAVSLNDREVMLRKRRGRVHDEIWTLLWEWWRDKMASMTPGSGDPLEERLGNAIVTAGNRLGPSWPSQFRNAVNYRPGYAYTAVRRTRVLDSYRSWNAPNTYSIEELIAGFENTLAAAIVRPNLDEDPQAIAELLVYFTFALHATTHELHSELLDRHGLDARWRNSRLRFLRSNDINGPSGNWPA